MFFHRFSNRLNCSIENFYACVLCPFIASSYRNFCLVICKNLLYIKLLVTKVEWYLKKMIREDNLDDTNKLYLVFPEVDGLHLKNCKMGQKTGACLG